MKKIFGLLLFSGLILVKVSAFHVHAHHDEDCEAIDDCEICDLVLENQASDLDIPIPFFTDINHVISIEEKAPLKSKSFSSSSNINLLFSRPPPHS
ncbi:hypothetical protein [Flagellimonas meridianipacifica]|nr:hypothetical protein [Allomuricauda pacifica]